MASLSNPQGQGTPTGTGIQFLEAAEKAEEVRSPSIAGTPVSANRNPRRRKKQ